MGVDLTRECRERAQVLVCQYYAFCLNLSYHRSNPPARSPPLHRYAVLANIVNEDREHDENPAPVPLDGVEQSGGTISDTRNARHNSCVVSMQEIRNGAAIDVEPLGPGAEVTVLIAATQPHVREALAAIVGATDGFTVVGEAGDSHAAVSLARSLRPTLAVVDVDLPDHRAAWTIQTLHDEKLASAIVALGLRADNGTRERACTAGAHSYVQTGAPLDELLDALSSALHAYPAKNGTHRNGTNGVAQSHAS